MTSIHLILTGAGVLLAAAGWLLRRQLLGCPGSLTRRHLEHLRVGDLAPLRRGRPGHYARLVAALAAVAEGGEAAPGGEGAPGPGPQRPEQGRAAFRGLPADAPLRRLERFNQELSQALDGVPVRAVKALLIVSGVAAAALLASAGWSLFDLMQLAEAGHQPADASMAGAVALNALADAGIGLAAFNGFLLLRYRAACRKGAGLLMAALERAISAVHEARAAVRQARSAGDEPAAAQGPQTDGDRALVVCPACGAENRPHYRFCLDCGGELPR